jgi:hypothetical protein
MSEQTKQGHLTDQSDAHTSMNSQFKSISDVIEWRSCSFLCTEEPDLGLGLTA